MTTDKADAADALLEGGDSPTERRCTFMHLLLTLFSGLNDEALHMLYKAAKPAILEKEGAVQKKAYRVLLQVHPSSNRAALAAPLSLHSSNTICLHSGMTSVHILPRQGLQRAVSYTYTPSPGEHD